MADTTGAVTKALYDTIGVGYSGVRRPDRRIEAQLRAAIGGSSRVLNVGAGTGSYEPTDRVVVAVEPSAAMIAQRPADAAPAIRAVADRLPFRDDAFDAGLALLTVHHWPDPIAGLTELRRVTSGPVVVLTFDHGVHARQWLVEEYLPLMAALDHDLPDPDTIADLLGGGTVEVVPVPFDCTDGFCHAWWRRPRAYLDPAVRAGISGIARLPARYVDKAMSRLSADLAGSWFDQHADLLTRESIDAGYRIVTAPGPGDPSG